MKGFLFLITLTGVLLLGITESVASTIEMTIMVGGKAKSVVIELDEALAPKTSANFKKLCSEGFYNGVAFHRVIPNYIVQGGDPLTKDAGQKKRWGTGGTGYKVPAELGGKHVRGAVASARLADSVNPDKASSGSQFYVALREISALDGEYTVFGTVTMGLEYFDEIARVSADDRNNPVDRVEIISTKVTEGAPSSSTPPMPKVTGVPAKDAPVAAAAAATAVAATKPAETVAAPKPVETAAAPKPVETAAAPKPAETPAAETAAAAGTAEAATTTAAAASGTEMPAGGVPPIPKLDFAAAAAAATESNATPAAEPAPAENTTTTKPGRGLPAMPNLTTAPSAPLESAAPPVPPLPPSVARDAPGSAAASAPSASPASELQPIPEMTSPSSPSSPPTDSPPFGPSSFTQPETSPGLPNQQGAALPAGAQMPAPANEAPPAAKKPEKPPGFFGKFLRKYW